MPKLTDEIARLTAELKAAEELANFALTILLENEAERLLEQHPQYTRIKNGPYGCTVWDTKKNWWDWTESPDDRSCLPEEVLDFIAAVEHAASTNGLGSTGEVEFCVYRDERGQLKRKNFDATL